MFITVAPPLAGVALMSIAFGLAHDDRSSPWRDLRLSLMIMTGAMLALPTALLWFWALLKLSVFG